jgi:hypothetical protein
LTAGLNKFSRVSSALGGLMVFVGILLIGIFALALFGLIDLEVFKSADYRVLLMLVLLVISILDLIAGIMLALR